MEEETATNRHHAQRKLSRILKRWAKILNPEMPKQKIHDMSDDELFNSMIQKTIKTLNKDHSGSQEREFSYTFKDCDRDSSDSSSDDELSI